MFFKNINKDSNENEFFETADFGLIVYLTYLGYKIVEIKKTNNKRKIFVFKRTPKIEIDIKQFWEREAMVEPQQFLNTIKYVKSRIYNS